MYTAEDRQRIEVTYTYSGRSEPPKGFKPFREDLSRLTHSPSFRRLQGKTQLFPGHESSFFRNRLTHSLEVANIASLITARLNSSEPFLKNPYAAEGDMAIDPDVVQFGALAHDLGHPPFGHTGEFVLDGLMRQFGGFEGNAQSLRIVGITEKREFRNEELKFVDDEGGDNRIGLNITYRGLASLLKYDNKIPPSMQDGKLVKGYYSSEADLVAVVKRKVTGPAALRKKGKFKTIECSIMDIADDIAYSTYDLEDALESELVRIADLMYPSRQVLDATVKSLTTKVSVNSDDVCGVLEEFVNFATRWYSPKRSRKAEEIAVFNELSQNGYLRTQFMSEWVEHLINGVKLLPDYECPALSEIRLGERLELVISVLKRFTYHLVTMSPRLQHVDFRGRFILETIFKALSDPDWADRLLPRDVSEMWADFGQDNSLKMRLVCDHISEMTDRAATELFGRLHSDSTRSIFSRIS